MKLRVTTLLWRAAFGPAAFRLLPWIKDGGFDGIEVPLFDPGSFDADAVRRQLEKHGLACTAVTIVPGGSSLASSDSDTRRKARAHLETCIAVAGDAGATLLSGPMYTPVGYMTGVRRTADEWKWAVDSWQALGPTVHAAGLEIGIEPLNRF